MSERQHYENDCKLVMLDKGFIQQKKPSTVSMAWATSVERRMLAHPTWHLNLIFVS